MYVECLKIPSGIRVIFNYAEGFESRFDFVRPADIERILSLIAEDIDSEELMIEVRNMMGLTLH